MFGRVNERAFTGKTRVIIVKSIQSSFVAKSNINLLEITTHANSPAFRLLSAPGNFRLNANSYTPHAKTPIARQIRRASILSSRRNRNWRYVNTFFDAARDNVKMSKGIDETR